jgi:glycosyltransferase involved in cell wall biosynthesis
LERRDEGDSTVKIFYLSVFKDGTGYSKAACEYASALDAVGFDVVCRALKLNAVAGEVSPRIAAMLEKPHHSKYDAVIQHILPYHMEFEGRLGRNIGLYFTETSNFSSSTWPQRINCMDEAWVANDQSRQASLDSGVSVPLHVVPIPCDVTKYEQSYKPLSLRDRLAGHFIFYWIGEFVHRKNLAALIRAFHTEFDVNEPVSLVIKTTPKGGQTEFDAKHDIEQHCRILKEGMKLYSSPDQYKKEIVIASRFSDETMMRLHASCDCGVWPAFGEAWCVPAFDGMALGKPPIVTDWGGFQEYINNDCGWLVPCYLEPVWGTHNDTFPDLMTSRENWARIDILELRSAMREAYENHDLYKEKSLAGSNRAYDFSYDKVGNIMKKVLNG